MKSDVYVLCSDDPLLKKDKAQELLVQAHQTLPDADFLLYTWTDLQSGSSALQELENEMSDPGLFGGDRIVKINLKDLDSTAIEVFKVISANFRSGLFIIIELPRINTTFTKAEAKSPDPLKRTLNIDPNAVDNIKSNSAKSKKPKKASLQTQKKDAISYLKGIGAQFISMYPPEGKEQLNWILQRGLKYNLSIEQYALELISRICDNNLLSIDQSLQILSMMNINGKINVEMVDNYFTSDSRYTGFELPVAICAGDSLKALNIIHSFCTGNGSNLSTSLSLLIGIMDEALQIIYLGKLQNVARLPYKEQSLFFLSNNVKVPSTQKAYLMAIKKMPKNLLDSLTYHLYQASKAYSNFDNQSAYMYLQNLALVIKKPNQVDMLKPL